MESDIRHYFLDQIQSKLQRGSIGTCSRWAEKYRKIKDPLTDQLGDWTFNYHPWLLEMHDCPDRIIIGQKAAQLGYTEWALNKAFFNIDIHALSVLYILPSDDDASDFSADRFGRALECSPHITKMFDSVRNVQHKRAGYASLYVRGSRSRSKLKSIDTALIIFDELDEMKQENLALAEMRQSGIREDAIQQIKLSTPTTPETGINVAYRGSSQDHFFFKCPSCSRLIELEYPDSIVITAQDKSDLGYKNSYYICRYCKVKLNHELKQQWLKHKLRGGTSRFVPGHTDRDTHGFYINQMYSSVVSPATFALAALEGVDDPTKATEFVNSRLGQPYLVEGAKLAESQILSKRRSYAKGPTSDPIVTMGVDVGGVMHVEIDSWTIKSDRNPALDINDEAFCKVLYEGRTSGAATDFNEVAALMTEYQVDFCVVDSEPERRAAYQFATRFWGKVYLCDFIFSIQGRAIIPGPEEECTVKVNRTSWMDLALGRFKNDTIILPEDVSPEYVRHICAPQRVYKKDKWGKDYGLYENTAADHLAFSRLYSELALVFAPWAGSTQDIYDV